MIRQRTNLRRRVRRRVVSDVFVLPLVRHASRDINMNTHESIDELPETDMVILDLRNGAFESYVRESLVCWIDSESNDNKSLTEIVV